MNVRKPFNFLRSSENPEIEDGLLQITPSIRLQKGRPGPIRTEGLVSQNAVGPSTASPQTPQSSRSGQQEEGRAGSRVSSILNFRKSRSSSIVGSWGRDDKPPVIAKVDSNNPISWEMIDSETLKYPSIIHHGEIQVPGASVRGLGNVQSKKQYAVLTTNQLFRFKNWISASQYFPTLHGLDEEDLQSKLSRSKPDPNHNYLLVPQSDVSIIDLADVVSVYNLDDGRPYFTIELACLEERELKGALAWVVTVYIENPQAFETWLQKLRVACVAACQHRTWDKESRLLRHAIKWMGRDFNSDRSRIFKVVQRVGHQSSPEAVSKFTTCICLLAVGQHKIHIIPIPRVDKAPSVPTFKSAPGKSHGIMSLTNFRSQIFDETFHVHFRLPLQRTTRYVFSSSDVCNVMNSIWQAAQYLRPAWRDLPFDWIVPEAPTEIEPLDAPMALTFDRTLEAYCEAYTCRVSSIKWRCNHDVEEAPQFVLLPPADDSHQIYDTHELLAVFRALRFDEYYSSLSFAGVDLGLLLIPDTHGSDHELWRTQDGQQIGLIQDQEIPLSLLTLEVRALLLTTRKLRRVDFSGCFPLRQSQHLQPDTCRKSVVEAILPLCERQLTNVDWICLNGISLSHDDVNYLYSALTRKACHFRAVEMTACGLEDRDFKNLVEGCQIQENTLESVNFSANPGLLDAHSLALGLGSLRHLRRLHLADVNISKGTQPLIACGLLSTWRLEHLNLGGTRLDASSLEHLGQYLESQVSLCLTWIGLCRCKITGGDIGRLLRSIHVGAKVRNMRLEVSSNSLEASGEHWQLVEAIRRSETPTHVILDSYEYDNGVEYQNLIRAVAQNRSLRFLSICGLAPSHIAPDDEGPFEAITSMLAKNRTLQSLEMSGDIGHVDATNLGVKLGSAMRGLESNQTLMHLRVEYQGLGFAGAGALADMIRKNRGIRRLIFDNNDINLQGFTTIVDAVERNRSLVESSHLDNDGAKDIRAIMEAESRLVADQTVTSRRSLTRTMKMAVMDQKVSSVRSSRLPTADRALSGAAESRREMWQLQRTRLQRHLERNRQL